MTTESDTCRKFVEPKLQASGWDNDPYSIAGQCHPTVGKPYAKGQMLNAKKMIVSLVTYQSITFRHWLLFHHSNRSCMRHEQ